MPGQGLFHFRLLPPRTHLDLTEKEILAKLMQFFQRLINFPNVMNITFDNTYVIYLVTIITIITSESIVKQTGNTKSKLLKNATKLFAQKGFEGVSVRDICKASEISVTAISNHFGGKEELLAAVLDQVNTKIYEPPLRVLAGGCNSAPEFEVKLKLFFKETLRVMLDNQNIVQVAVREIDRSKFLLKLQPYQNEVIKFLSQAQKKGFVSHKIDIEMLSGIFIDRTLVQVLYKDNIQQFFNISIDDDGYRERWVTSTIDFFLYGFLKR